MTGPLSTLISVATFVGLVLVTRIQGPAPEAPQPFLTSPATVTTTALPVADPAPAREIARIDAARPRVVPN